jgi:hypothetical protein
MSSSFRKQLIRKTKAAGTIVNGVFVDGATTPTNIMASVQPLKPHEIEHLPEGRRDSQAYWLFTDTKLNTVTSANPDLITIDNEDYEVNKIEPWQNNVLSHYKVLVVKVLEI